MATAAISSLRSYANMSLTFAPMVCASGPCWGSIQEQDSLDHDSACLISSMDCFLMYWRVFVSPVFAHLSMQEILVDGGKLFTERTIQSPKNQRITLHANQFFTNWITVHN